MRFAASSLVLGTLAVGQAAAATMMHGKMHNHAARHAEIMKAHQESRDIEQRDASGLMGLLTQSAAAGGFGFHSLGMNPTAASNTPWIGAGGKFTNTFYNNYADEIVLVVWGPAGSWVNAIQPQLTVSIPAGSSQQVSFPVGWSGAWAPVHANTAMVNGQISDTWGEGSFMPPYSVVDVSREVNMNGKGMSIQTPNCKSDMQTCVFQCSGGASTCLTGYELVNCATGSQAGANFGTFGGAASGGCGGMGDSADLKTYLWG